MLILKHPWDKKKVRKLVDYLYTSKTRRDPMTHYMKNELNSEMLNYLLQNPSLFASYYLYQQFVEMYFPDFASEHPTFTSILVQMAMVNDMQRRQRRHQRMYEINYQRLMNDTRQIRNDKRITHTLQLNVDLDRILRETTIDLTAQHEQTLERTINQLNKAIEKEGLIDIPHIRKNPKLQEKLTQLNKQIERENKRLEKNKTNRVLWQKARLLDDKYKPTFKVWDQHPNPKTRHNLTDGQKVKLEEKFIVINDKTGDIDYVDYPGDWTCSASNGANCLCSLSFTNDPQGYVEHENLVENYKSKSEKIKLNIQTKRAQKQQEKAKREQLKQKKEINKIQNKLKNQIQNTKTFIKEKTKDIKNKIIIHNKQDKRNIDWTEIKTIKDIQDKLEYDFEINKKGEYHFTDKYGTDIIFGTNYTKPNPLIDPTNSGKSNYDMVNMIMFYEAIPPNIKKIIPSINFKNKAYKNNKGKYEWDTLGYTNPDSLDINIFPIALRQNYNERGNVCQTMYHEIGHILDRKMAAILVRYNRKYGISEDHEWDVAVQNDIELQRRMYISKYGSDEGFYRELASFYGERNESENWAETFAMAMFSVLDNKEMAVMVNNKNQKRNYTKWTKLHKFTFNFAKQFLTVDWEKY